MFQAFVKVTLGWNVLFSSSVTGSAKYTSTDVAKGACTQLDSLHAGDLQDSIEVDRTKISQSFMQLASSTGALFVSASVNHTGSVHTNNSVATTLAFSQQVMHRLALDLRRELTKRMKSWPEICLVVGAGLISGVLLVCALRLLIFSKGSNRAARQQPDAVDSSSVSTAAATAARQLIGAGQPTAAGQRTLARRSTRSSCTIVTTGSHTTGTGSPRSIAEHEMQPCPQLCQGLVVPAGSECVLAVKPAHRYATRPGPLSVEVFDMNGKPVLALDIKRPLGWEVAFEKPNPTLGQPAVALRSQGDGKAIHATGREGKTSDGRNCMFLYDSSDDLFARLTKDLDSSRYVLSGSRGDWEVIFDGNFHAYATKAYNKRQEQLADTELCQLAFSQDNVYKSKKD